jgi:hypothetical protein
VLIILFTGMMILKLAQPDSIRIPLASAQATATPTLVPVAAANPLPIIVGGDIDDEFNSATLDHMWEAGLRWVATVAEPDVAIPADMLAEVAEDIRQAHERGFGILVHVADSSDAVTRMHEDDYQAFGEFIGQLAALGPDAIEIWPEPNLDRAWPTGEISGEAYVEMLRAAYEAVKAANPDVWVISGAPAPTGAGNMFPGQVVNDDQFYREMAEAGAASYADCIGVHYVEGIVPPTQTEDDPRDDYPTRYLGTMVQRAAEPFRETSLPLCFTELGYASFDGVEGEIPTFFAWAANTSVDEQAQWVAGAIQTLAELSSVRVAMVNLWNIDATPDEYAAAYSIIRPDGTCLTCETIAALKQE